MAHPSERDARAMATGIVTALRSLGGVVTSCGIHPSITGVTVAARVNGISVMVKQADGYFSFQSVASDLLALALAGSAPYQKEW